MGAIQNNQISIHRSLTTPDYGLGIKIININISIHRSLTTPDHYKLCLLCPLLISIHRSLTTPDIRLAQVFSLLSIFQSTGVLRLLTLKKWQKVQA